MRQRLCFTRKGGAMMSEGTKTKPAMEGTNVGCREERKERRTDGRKDERKKGRTRHAGGRKEGRADGRKGGRKDVKI